MGIEIVSVLAKHSTKLASSSGVTLKPLKNNIILLPDPHQQPAQYVKEVISQWSSRKCRRPPTWEQQLAVIQDIDLLQLSQPIEDFMKGE